MHHRWWDSTKISGSNISSCPTYGQSLLTDLSLDVWTPSSHSTGTALCIWQQAVCHHTLLCGIIPPFWHGILSLLGCQYTPPPPSVVGSAMLHPRHHPLFFVSLRFSLARRQCPSLGTKYWREPNKRTNQPFPSQSSPRIPPIIMDQRQIVMGVFFVPSSTSFSVCSATQLNELSVNHWKMSCSRHLYLKQQWVTVPAMFWLFLCWVSLRWRSWIYYTIRLLYSPTEQPFSNHRQLGYSPW